MPDVGQEEFLVLLLVLKADARHSQSFFGKLNTCEQVEHVLIDMRAICQNALQAGPGHQAPGMSGLSIADLGVVTVEQIREAFVESCALAES